MDLLCFDMFCELGHCTFVQTIFSTVFSWKIIKQIALRDRNIVSFQGRGQIYLMSRVMKIMSHSGVSVG